MNTNCWWMGLVVALWMGCGTTQSTAFGTESGIPLFGFGNKPVLFVCERTGPVRTCLTYRDFPMSVMDRNKDLFLSDQEMELGAPQSAYNQQESACVAGDTEACNSHGLRLVLGGKYTESQPHDPKTGLGLIQKACDGGLMRACQNLAALERRRGEKDSDVKSLPLYKKACDGGDALACEALGALHQYGVGTAKDVQKSLGFYKKACDGGRTDTCFLIANIFTVEMKKPAQAITFLKKGCEHKVESNSFHKVCGVLGAILLNGDPAVANSRDPELGFRLLKRSCAGGHAPSCTVLKKNTE